MKYLIKIFALSFGLATATTAAPAHAAVLTYIGAGTDWFTAGNWDLGYVPGANDDVVIGAGRVAVIDPSNGPRTVTFRDLTITDGAQLETLSGVKFTTRNETLSEGGTLVHRATRALDVLLGGTLTALAPTTPSGSGLEGPVFNPSPKTKRVVILQSCVTFGLGGTLPASNSTATAHGGGYYATLTTDDATLGGDLDLRLFYGFSPSIGQTFQIINVGTTRVGTFAGLPEGALVKRFAGVGMYISYVGGDGNDVVLTAAP